MHFDDKDINCGSDLIAPNRTFDFKYKTKLFGKELLLIDRFVATSDFDITFGAAMSDSDDGWEGQKVAFFIDDPKLKLNQTYTYETDLQEWIHVPF
jgi:hypothetical protein